MSDRILAEADAQSRELRAKSEARFLAAVKRQHAEGFSLVTIARNLGCSRERVSSALERLGLPKPRAVRSSVWSDL